jgi:hypothetical protein
MTGFQSKKASAEDKLFDREAIIDYLCDSDFDYIMNGDGLGAELLDSYIRNGFKGYVSYSDAELKTEFEQRKEMENE